MTEAMKTKRLENLKKGRERKLELNLIRKSKAVDLEKRKNEAFELVENTDKKIKNKIDLKEKKRLAIKALEEVGNISESYEYSYSYATEEEEKPKKQIKEKTIKEKTLKEKKALKKVVKTEVIKEVVKTEVIKDNMTDKQKFLKQYPFLRN